MTTTKRTPRGGPPKLNIRWRKTTATWVIFAGRSPLETGFHSSDHALEFLCKRHPERVDDFPPEAVAYAAPYLQRWVAELRAAKNGFPPDSKCDNSPAGHPAATTATNEPTP